LRNAGEFEFFARGDRSDTSDPGLVSCWYSEDNFDRLDRAKELATRRGVLPIQIALAYVLCQPFPSFALIGPSTIDELRTSVEAMSIGFERLEIELPRTNLGSNPGRT
jgi:aryl-alcohol dehydrogenase-like predicted oxidoreductase